MSEKIQDAVGEQSSKLLSKVLERLQDALFEPCNLVVRKSDSEDDSDDDNDQGFDLSQWNVPTNHSGAEFRERMKEFEEENYSAFTDVDEEYTLQHTSIHNRFQSLIEDEIVSILQDEFDISNRDFYRLLRTLQDNTRESELLFNGSAELLGLLNNILDFESFCKDMKAKAKKSKGNFISNHK